MTEEQIMELPVHYNIDCNGNPTSPPLVSQERVLALVHTEQELQQKIRKHQGELPGDIYYRYCAMRMLLNEALEIWERQLHEANADDSVWIEGPEHISGVRDWIDKAKRAPQGEGETK